MNRGTGAVTLIGPLLGPTNPNGLAYAADVQTMFSKASWVTPDYLIFNICGNSYQLIVTINFPAGIVYVKEFMAHNHYDAWLPDSHRLQRIKVKKAVDKKTQKRQPRRNEP